ncbi:JAB domain-containing protein [Litorivivens sp.]|uniref:JAB domain-containing protein n=1 Tax=Litorivivens sp. TaxID=2020868 RepID=UPI003564563A
MTEQEVLPLKLYPQISPEQQATIQEAIGILESTLRAGDAFTSAVETKKFCRLKLGTARDEYFGCLFLDNQHRLLSFERLFRGTVAGAAVYPRVVVRRSLELNAAAVILTHNHPSGVTEPSKADNAMTSRLIHALGLIDVRVLDHVIVSAEGELSMAEQGLL